MLSIGLFTYSSKPRGSVVHTASLAEALTALGHEVIVYALSKYGDGFYRELPCEIRLIPAAEAPLEFDALVRQRVAEFSDVLPEIAGRHDVYHAQDCLAANALLLAPAELRLFPVVRTVHHVEHFTSQYLIDCQRRSIELADDVLSVSELTRQEVLDEFRRPTALVPNGVDLTRFIGRSREVEGSLRKRFGIDDDDRIVISVGGVEPRKNSLRSLDAVAKAYPQNPRLRWLLVGGASIWDHKEYRAEFERRLRMLPDDLRARIVSCGQLSDPELTALYQMSDVLLCPSEREGWGLCVLEAMAAETAVLVSDQPPFTEYLDRGCARFVVPHAVESIAAALSELLVDRELQRQMIEAGLKRVERMSWHRSAEVHADHYSSLLAQSSPSLRAHRI
jgi:glycosyltransferase-like protein